MALNRDEDGIIGQIQSDGSVDGGDSACWMGHYIYLTDDDFPYVKTFEKGYGGYVRHPKSGFATYYENPWNGNISRDQLTGIIGGLVRQKEYKALLRLIVHHGAWLWLFSYNTVQNGVDPKVAPWKWPDATLFDIWATILRGFGKFSWIFWPLLCILDLHMLVNTMIVNRSDKDDKINYALKLMISREFVPTPTSWLSAKLLNKEHLISSLKEYWCGWRDNCDFVPLYEKKINSLI